MSAVEVLYQSFPIFIYLNSSFGKPLLSPLLEFQDSPQYTLQYAARDLGNHLRYAWYVAMLKTLSLGENYPVASGDTASHQQGVERASRV